MNYYELKPKGHKELYQIFNNFFNSGFRTFNALFISFNRNFAVLTVGSWKRNGNSAILILYFTQDCGPTNDEMAVELRIDIKLYFNCLTLRHKFIEYFHFFSKNIYSSPFPAKNQCATFRLKFGQEGLTSSLIISSNSFFTFEVSSFLPTRWMVSLSVSVSRGKEMRTSG